MTRIIGWLGIAAIVACGPGCFQAKGPRSPSGTTSGTGTSAAMATGVAASVGGATGPASASTGSRSASTGGFSASTSSVGSSSGTTGTGGANLCVGDSSLIISIGDGVFLPPPPDGGPPVGLWLPPKADAGVTLLFATGAHPFDGACDSLGPVGCGHCDTLSITLPPGAGPGTYDTSSELTTSLGGGFAGSVTLQEVGPDYKGTFIFTELAQCGICGGSVKGTFDIPMECNVTSCKGPPPDACYPPIQVVPLPLGPGGWASPTQAIFASLRTGSSELDLVATDLQSTGFDVAMADGQGGYSPGSEVLLIPHPPGISTGGNINGIAAGDLNRDGRTDLVVASSLGMGVFVGHGDGTFAAPVYYSSFPDGGDDGPGRPLIADLNGDGLLDVAVSTSVEPGVAIYFGSGDGALTLAQTLAFPSDSRPGMLVAADFNGDGQLDLVVADQGPSHRLFFLAGRGHLGFDLPTVVSTSENTFALWTTSLVAAVLRPDSGVVDLVVSNQGDGGMIGSPGNGFGIDVLLGNGDGTFAPSITYADPAQFDALGSVAVADVNGDGNPDLVGVFDAVSTYGTDLGVWLGRGDGTFAESPMPVGVDDRSGYGGDTSLAVAPGGGGVMVLVADPYLPDLIVQDVTPACFQP